MYVCTIHYLKEQDSKSNSESLENDLDNAGELMVIDNSSMAVFITLTIWIMISSSDGSCTGRLLKRYDHLCTTFYNKHADISK